MGVLASVLQSSNTETNKWIEANLKDVSITPTYEDILQDSTIKAIIVSTPIDTHFKIAEAALDSKKHVFLEKPATGSSDKLNILIEKANKNNLVFQVGYEFVFSENLKKIKKRLEEKTIRAISFKWYKWGSFKAHPVINLLVHQISILKFLGVNDIKIQKYEQSKIEEFPHKIYIEAISSNIPISFDIDISSEVKEHTISIETTADIFIWKDEGENLIEQEMLSFISSINHETTETFPDGKFAKEILEIIETIPY